MKIQEVMTASPTWCLPEDPSIQAARIMEELNVGIVPVVKSLTDRRLVGVVTDRDLCLAVVAMDQQPQAVSVQECMTTNMVACHPDEDIQQAADLMEENQVRRIPVVDQQGILQGMISTADICQRTNLSSDTTHQILKKVTEPTDHASKPRANMPHKAA
ncbi:MAG TPA: CBS domain-containing protein [Nitrospiraceae bacterium]|nr:CBS domain-containing protein [Nitrospiraceae bacterium]